MHRVTNEERHTVCHMTKALPDGMKGWVGGQAIGELIAKLVVLPPVEYCIHTPPFEDA